MLTGKGRRRPVGEGLVYKTMGIHFFPNKGNEQIVPLHGVGIQADVFYRRFGISQKKPPAAGLSKLSGCHMFHHMPPCSSFVIISLMT